MKYKQIWEYSLYDIISVTMEGVFEDKDSNDFKFAVLVAQDMTETLNSEEREFVNSHQSKLMKLSKTDENAFFIRSKAIKDAVDMILENYHHLPGRIEYQRKSDSKM